MRDDDSESESDGETELSYPEVWQKIHTRAQAAKRVKSNGSGEYGTDGWVKPTGKRFWKALQPGTVAGKPVAKVKSICKERLKYY